MTFEPMFSVPFYHYEIENWSDVKKNLKNVIGDLDERHLSSDKKVYSDFFTQMGSDSLPSYYPNVLEVIKPYLVDFFSIGDHVGNSVQCTDMWYQETLKGQEHGIHNHGSIGWSSIIYFDFNPKVHQATKFFAPFNNYYTGNMISVSPIVEEGNMVIFPSSIAHVGPVNESDEKRSVISFNLR